MDDTPTANPETQAWLRQLASAPDAAALPASAFSPLDGRGSGRATLDRALERVRAGEPEAGIEMLIRQAAQERSARERFMRRSEAASIMVDAGREAVALPILEELVKEIDQHTLETWESGEIVARTLALMYRCIKRISGDNSTTQSLYLRICRLDPMQAIDLAGQPAK
jgi:type VI secretion system protein ImpA